MKKQFLLLSFLFLPLLLMAQENLMENLEAFPNLHPLMVHFPLVFLLIAAGMQIALMFFKSKPFNITIIVLTVVGFITGYLSTTVFHAHPSHNISPAAHELFEEHERLATITLWLSGIASVIKLAGLFIHRKWIEIVALLFLVGSAVTVSLAGHHGAELVYKQGIGPQGEKLETEHDEHSHSEHEEH